MSILNIFWTHFDPSTISRERIERVNNILPSSFQTDWETLNEKQKISFAAKLLLNELAEKHYGFDKAVSTFFKDENGKPHFKETALKFNISHTKNLIGIAFSEVSDLGLDIQVHKTFNPKIIDRVYCPEEHEYSQIQTNKNVFFFDTWTKKEAAVKTSGVGIKSGFKKFSVLENTAIVEEQELHIQNINILKGYSSAIACNRPILNINIQKI